MLESEGASIPGEVPKDLLTVPELPDQGHIHPKLASGDTQQGSTLLVSNSLWANPATS